jgi:acetaldehyde dehydrogenase (acetylating)
VINPVVVGKQPQEIARLAVFAIPPDAKLMIVELRHVGRDDPLSREKLCPVLGFFVEDGWERCCERAIELLNYGGLGHSLGIHSRDPYVIDRFFEEKPAFRIIVNSNVAIGAVGYTTGFAPAMTLGPGSWGGSITSDNVTPLHLINIKRLGEEIRPYLDPLRRGTTHRARVTAGPAVGSAPEPAALAPSDVQRIVEEFLADFRGAGR